MKERFIKILKGIDQQHFETTINKLQSFQLTPESALLPGKSWKGSDATHNR